MDEARRLHFAQVCADAFSNIRATFDGWKKQAADPAKPQDKAKASAFLKDAEGLVKRTAVAGPADPANALASRQHFLFESAATILHAQLQSRLMVNMAGGVMENAGLCLDRFGLPYLPGSAVKGCARRAALAALHEWCEAGGKPEHRPSGDDNVFTSACASFASPGDMLAAIARVFGWCEQDWSLAGKGGRYVSDFAWACGDAPGAVWKSAAEKLASDFGWRIDDEHTSTPWEALPNFSGNVAFLPAYPADIPAGTDINGTKTPTLGKLDLDVVTCHHRDYYDGKLPTATDTEEPVPVVFPAVAPGHVFAFALAPLRGRVGQVSDLPVPATSGGQEQQPDGTLQESGSETPGTGRPEVCPTNLARSWLHTGLQTFGLGAKTNAGYGWFDCSDTIQAVVASLLARASLKMSEPLLTEMRGWSDKQVRAAARPFMFQNEQMWPKSGREAAEDYRFTLISFILNEKKPLFEAEKKHAGSDFAKGVKRLAEKFGISIA